MAKRKRSINIQQRIKEEYGVGIGSKYKPWIKIQDVPSLGRVTRVKGIKTNRQHEFLSDMERDYFYILEYSDNVLDIREQYPLLPIEDTICIANELGIDHPKNPQTGEYIVMTTDFLVTVSTNDGIRDIARTIKSKDDLLNKRVIQKFSIEKEYWKRKDINWGIVTEKEINKTVANNFSFVKEYKDIRNVDSFREMDSGEIRDLIREFFKRLIDDGRSIRAICMEFDKDMYLEVGSSLCIFRYLIVNKVIKINMLDKIDVSKQIEILSINEEQIRRVEAI